MKRSPQVVMALIACVVTAGLAGLSSAGTLPAASVGHVAYDAPRSFYEARVNLAEPERARIQRHLAAVETMLRMHPPAGLSEAQLRNRLARLDDLRAYREAGEFPKNLDFPDRLIPYFIDAAGVPCAVGHLIIASGHADLAEDVRRTRNHAYIREIDDPRLVAWLEESGLTAEEAGMIQPGYGPPSMTLVQQVSLDGTGRPWVFGPDNNNIGYSALGYRDGSQWRVHEISMHAMGTWGACVTGAGEPMLVNAPGVVWKGRTFHAASLATSTFFSCAWTRNDSDAWVGGRHGLVRMTRIGQDSLTRTDFNSALVSDTVTFVAVTSERVWAGTPRGVYARNLSNPGTIEVWDSVASDGTVVTGLATGPGAAVWVGIEGVAPSSGFPQFSTRGMYRFNGTTWQPYRAATSSVFVPGDTILALAVRDTASVWIAVRDGFFRFDPSAGGGQKVADIPANTAVYDLAGNSQEFYAGTDKGVYHFRNDSLVFLGSPVVSLRPRVARGRESRPDAGLRFLQGGEPVSGQTHTILGQKVPGNPAQGIYLVRPPARE